MKSKRLSFSSASVIIGALTLLLAIGFEYKYAMDVDALSHTIQQYTTQISDLKQKNTTLEQELQMVSKEKKILEDNIKYLQDLDINSMRVPKPTSLNRGGTVPNINTIKVRATGYGAYEGGTGTCKTKMGTTPIQGKTIAVDPRVIPLGSEVYVFCKDYPEVNGWHVAEDIGGAIKGNKIDVYFDDIHTPRSVANKTIAQFGVRDVTLYIMKK